MFKPIISTSQKTQKLLELKEHRVRSYVQFGKAKLNKKGKRIVVNPLTGLINARDKLKQQLVLEEHGIKKPKFFTNVNEAIEFIRVTGNPIVAKRHFHSKGRGMKKFTTAEELENDLSVHNGYYYQEFVKCNREWRIHVSRFQDTEVVAYRKCYTQEIIDGYRDNDLEKPWFRNLENCYFKLDVEDDKMEWWNDMVLECKKAIEALGMDIAGVDVGENTKIEGGAFYIYEVNSACGMEENTRAKYAEAIDTIIEEKIKLRNL